MPIVSPKLLAVQWVWFSLWWRSGLQRCALGGTHSVVDFFFALLVQFAAALGGELLGHSLGGGLLVRAPCAVFSSSWWLLLGHTLGGGLLVHTLGAVCSTHGSTQSE